MSLPPGSPSLPSGWVGRPLPSPPPPLSPAAWGLPSQPCPLQGSSQFGNACVSPTGLGAPGGQEGAVVVNGHRWVASTAPTGPGTEEALGEYVWNERMNECSNRGQVNGRAGMGTQVWTERRNLIWSPAIPLPPRILSGARAQGDA